MVWPITSTPSLSVDYCLVDKSRYLSTVDMMQSTRSKRPYLYRIRLLYAKYDSTSVRKYMDYIVSSGEIECISPLHADEAEEKMPTTALPRDSFPRRPSWLSSYELRSTRRHAFAFSSRQ
jgi:hypothetical protein